MIAAKCRFTALETAWNESRWHQHNTRTAQKTSRIAWIFVLINQFGKISTKVNITY